MSDEPKTSARDTAVRVELRRSWSWSTIVAVAVVLLLLTASADRLGLPAGVGQAFDGIGEAVGLTDESDVGRGMRSFLGRAWPPVHAERTAASRIEDFDPDDLPWLAYTENEVERVLDERTGEWTTTAGRTFLVEPGRYVLRVLGLMLQTIEIGLWGTLLALILALPLAWFATSGYTPNRATHAIARMFCSLSRSIPELISAMFFVLLFGFGAVPGVLALGFHCAGFLGKFFADDIENADPGPQEALIATGASKLKVMRMAVLPQVMPQFLAYLQYILERNVRSATVLGIVGAGGIGMELKGRWDMSNFGHVTTILIAIFVSVQLLEQLTQAVRRRLL